MNKRGQRKIRHRRIRARIKGTKDCPRLSVFRSNRYLCLQLIDDDQSKTLIGVSSKEIKKSMTKVEKAKELGHLLGEEAIKQGIKKIVFDRGGYKYHGQVKAAAEGAREKGLIF